MNQRGKYGDNTGRDVDGRFSPGNSGRPRGTRNKATEAALSLLEGEAEAITRKVITQALAGDPIAMRLCLERILAPRRSRPVSLDLPNLAGADDAARAVAEVLHAVSSGDIAASDGKQVVEIIESYRRALETAELEARLSTLEARFL